MLRLSARTLSEQLDACLHEARLFQLFARELAAGVWVVRAHGFDMRGRLVVFRGQGPLAHVFVRLLEACDRSNAESLAECEQLGHVPAMPGSVAFATPSTALILEVANERPRRPDEIEAELRRRFPDQEWEHLRKVFVAAAILPWEDS